MKKTIIYILLLGAIALLCSSKCSSTKSGDSKRDQSNAYYSGKLSVDADGVPVQFVDCATHITMNINLNNSNKRDVSKFKKSADNGVVFVSFTGEIMHTEAEQEAVPGSIIPTINMDNILSLGDESVCFHQFVIAGLYSIYNEEMSESRVLHLRPNYTYTLTKFLSDDTQIKSEGVWYRNDIFDITLKQSGADTELKMLKIAPADELLQGSEDGEIYSKLYI